MVALLAWMLVTLPTAETPPLTPDELVLIYNSGIPASREAAEYYARQRNVPADHLIGLPCTSGDQIERDAYNAFAGQLRQALRNAGLESRVRCLVTFYGLPIRVGPFRPTPQQQTLARELERSLAQTAQELEESVAELEALATRPQTRPATSRPAGRIDIDLRELSARYARAAGDAVGRIGAEKSTTRRSDLVQRLFLLVERVEGKAGLILHLNTMPADAYPYGANRLRILREELKQQEARINTLLKSPVESAERAEARQRIGEFQGLLGLGHILREDRNRIEGDETAAAFDSELALLWWDDYPMHRWILNLQAWRVRADASLRQMIPAGEWKRTTLMVARLDAATPTIVHRMIDDALYAEEHGLTGTCYLDARGIAKDSSYGAYDENLRELAALLKNGTSWPVKLDNRPELFQPGDCPDAALYCGWYSLRKYVPAFTFVRGAVGYHIASLEALSLTRLDERGWCRNLLKDGVAATLGPVAEPYLNAFPPPKDFFGLMMTGRFTLAECFACTNPFNSWMIMLLGDPLYRPFAKQPALSLDRVFPKNLIPPEYGGATTAPAAQDDAR